LRIAEAIVSISHDISSENLDDSPKTDQDSQLSSHESQSIPPEEDAASPVPRPAEPSAAFVQLKKYCDAHGIKSAIEVDPPLEYVSMEFKNGRMTRTVLIASDETIENLLQVPLEDIVFLGEYSAICSYKEGWIEAAVRGHGPSQRRMIARRKIFGINSARSDEPAEIEIPSPSGLTLRLTEKRGILSWLDYAAPIYLRLEGIGITEHDKALNLLEDLSNSLFMQIDFRFDSALTLGKDRLLSRRLSKAQQLDEDNQLTYPRFSYEKSPSALYWYARSATSMPLLQFLAFYQCIEFFFPQYSRQATIARIKNVLKDPSFDGTKDSSINIVLNATIEGRRGALLDERKQLVSTLKQCIDATALLDFLNETEERKQYYRSDYKKISDRKIALSDEAAIVDQTSERIYDIRCKVVHTKNLEDGGGEDMILPFSEEADLLMDDVELIQFLARRVLIASSAPLKT
jgi:hypothetical protein